MRRDALTLILCGTSALVAIVVATLAGPVAGVATLAVLFIPVSVFGLHLKHRKVAPDEDERTEDQQAEDEVSAQAPSMPEEPARPLEIVEDQSDEDLADEPPALTSTAPQDLAPIVEDTPTETESVDITDAAQPDEATEEDEPDAVELTEELIEAFNELLAQARTEDAHETDEADAPSFSWTDIEYQLLSAARPIRVLSKQMRQIARRKDEGNATPAERFFAQRVEDTGVLDKSVEKKARVVRLTALTRSDLLYLKGLNSKELDYDAYVSLLSLEAALNTMRLAHEHFEDLANVSEVDLTSFEQRLMTHVLKQAPLIDTADWTYLAMPWQFPAGPAEHGEWSCRHQLAETIESLRLPWRLRTRFHANVNDGTLAIEFDATPADALPKHTFLAELGMVPTTGPMRRRDASAYAARVGLLLCALGFASSRRIRRVFVKATHDTPQQHLCLFSIDLDRRTFSHLRLQALTDPVATLSALGGSVHVTDGELEATRERFHLGDPRFCPPYRHDIMVLKDHKLPASAAHALGASHLLGLSIHEELGRSIAADDVLRLSRDNAQGMSAEESVKAIMDVAGATSDLSVWDAATRCARQIVEGTLSCDDAWAIHEELVDGDELTRALMHSQELFGQGEPEKAMRLLEDALATLDRRGIYVDSESVAYRSFDSYTERVLYNRMSADDKRVVSLVPDSYLIAHVTLASLFLAASMEDNSHLDRSLDHIRRALTIAPMNTPATILLATILAAKGDKNAANQVLSDYLAHAFHPQGIGLAYLKLAESAAEEGDERRAFSCYQMCLHTMPALTPVVFAESQMLAEQGLRFPDDMGMKDVQECLESAGIPLAPTQHTFYDLFDGAIAATDAEVFPVARDMMSFIEALTGDDVMHAVRESLEREPDT